MNNKKKIIFIVFSIIFIVILSISIILIPSKESINDDLVDVEIAENNDSLNVIENTTSEISNTIIKDISAENLVSDAQVENTLIQEADTQVIDNSTPTPPSTPTSTNDKKSSSSNSSTTKNTNAKTTSTTTPVNTASVKEETKNTSQEVPTVSKQTTTTESTPKKETPVVTTPKEESHPELAHTSYRKVNTSIVPEIISILNSEIAKQQDLVDFGSTALKGNKTDAYSKTTPFTYLYVNDITKGKVAGNYTTFTQRVKNNIGAFGKYYVYAEDEYVYDGKGLNPMWSQTLVWIYITF